MRLSELKGHGEFSLTEFVGDHIPPYAILSHTWGEDGAEVTFKDLVDSAGKSKAGYTSGRIIVVSTNIYNSNAEYQANVTAMTAAEVFTLIQELHNFYLQTIST